jgi:tripartite-type tricarboxylate transporter receptor subunit TctC
VGELIDYAKSKSADLTYGTPGVGTSPHMSMELFKSMAHVDIRHIPYRGTAPAVTDIISGQIHAMLLTIPAVMPYVSAGKLRAIATSGKKRSPALPELPTLDESGLSGFEYSPWYGVFAPAGTPVPVLNKIHAAMLALKTEDERWLGRRGRAQGTTLSLSQP